MYAIQSAVLPGILVALTLLVSLCDLRTRRVPNWATLPLLAAGFVAHFPGTAETWLGCLLLFLGWRFGGMGAGDVKLWMALLWATPPDAARSAVYVMWAVILVTGLTQMGWRKVRGVQVAGVRSPAAWRTIPFAIWLMVYSLWQRL